MINKLFNFLAISVISFLLLSNESVIKLLKKDSVSMPNSLGKKNLDKNIINDLEKKFNKKYIFTFNISNIYLSNNSLLPLIKCNRCEIQT